MNFLSASQQEYVFDAEDGHTEIMPVRHVKCCDFFWGFYILNAPKTDISLPRDQTLT